MIPEKRKLDLALKHARQITGFSTGDECQVNIGMTNFCFVKDGKAWRLLEVMEFTDETKKRKK